jgi:hypothetical protein
MNTSDHLRRSLTGFALVFLPAALLSSTALPSRADGPGGVAEKIDACTLLLAPEIERVIGLKVDSGERKDEGPSPDGSYSSTCVWKIRTSEPAPADSDAPMGGASFVILNAIRWPAGSDLARGFLAGFRAAAARGEIKHTPIPKSLGEEALWWGDGLAVRQHDVSFGISVFLQAGKAKYRGFFEERLAPRILARIDSSGKT